MSDPVYVIGAGLSGLSAAVALAREGRPVEVIEAAGFAGGRCRSYYDSGLGQIIDNGNHLILSGNKGAHEFLRTIGAGDNFAEPRATEYAFADLKTGERWTLTPNDGPVPWWVFDRKRRVPGTKATDYFALTKLLRPNGDGALAQLAAGHGALWRKLVQPLLVAALNTDPEEASPALIAAILRETLAKGGESYRPRVASPNLSAAFIDPALTYLKAKGAVVRFGQRVRGLAFDGARVSGIALGDGNLSVSPDGAVILAVPPWAAKDLLPEISVPDEFRAIVSLHYRAVPHKASPLMLGLINATSEWVFAFPDRVSVTISNADRLIDEDRETLARTCWGEAAAALGLSNDLPPWQVVKEKRATFAATAAQNAKRPGTGTRWSNLFLAGDWTDTGLPATIEGAVRSGKRAAELALARVLV